MKKYFKITLSEDVYKRQEPVDIEEYMEYLKVYKREDNEMITNGERGLKRKMSALRSFYSYYFKHQYIACLLYTSRCV